MDKVSYLSPTVRTISGFNLSRAVETSTVPNPAVFAMVIGLSPSTRKYISSSILNLSFLINSETCPYFSILADPPLNICKSISYGLVGQSIETEDGVEVYSQNAGDSKDLFNPFRKPKIQELNHLQKMVEEIYNDFAIEVSKTRKIELDRVKKNIGALIYTSNQAKENFLIDDVLNFNQLLNKISKEQNMLDYKIIENQLDYNIFEKFFLSKKTINLCDKVNSVLLSVSPTYLRNCFIN